MPTPWAISSAVEHLVYTEIVTSSILVSPMKDYQLYTWFPVPVYATVLENYDSQSIIDNLETPSDDNPNYFGDSREVTQVHHRKEFLWLNEQIKLHTTQYLSDLGAESVHNIAVQKSWAVVLSENGSVNVHNHPNSHLSCVFYPRSSTGKINFYREYHPLKHLPITYKEHNDYSYDWCSYEPIDGMLLIFPSTLRHGVSNHQDSDLRYSVSYDLILTTDKSYENTVLSPENWLFL